MKDTMMYSLDKYKAVAPPNPAFNNTFFVKLYCNMPGIEIQKVEVLLTNSMEDMLKQMMS